MVDVTALERANAKTWESDSLADGPPAALSAGGDSDDSGYAADEALLIDYSEREDRTSDFPPPVLPGGISNAFTSRQPGPRDPPGLPRPGQAAAPSPARPSMAPRSGHRLQENAPAQQPGRIRNRTPLSSFDRNAYGHPGAALLPRYTSGAVGPSYRQSTSAAGLQLQHRHGHSAVAAGRGRPPVSVSTSQRYGNTGGASGARNVGSLAKWGGATELHTKREATHKEIMAAVEQNRDEFRKSAESEQFPTMGYYLWPTTTETPAALLGWRLEVLDPLRFEHRVFIEAIASDQCIKISGRIPGQDMVPIVDGIRLAVKHARTQKMRANNVYFVIPPHASAIKTIVRPRESRPAPNKFAKFLELAGADLTAEEKVAWDQARPGEVLKLRERFQKTLFESLSAIEALKVWMSMRIYFGYVELTAYYKGFAASAVTYERFAKMVCEPRQTGSFDKKIDAKTVMIFREKILTMEPPKFVPVLGHKHDLRKVAFKDTEVVFFRNAEGRGLRLEAEIDRVKEKGATVYQVGSVRLFSYDEDEKKTETGRNKLIQMTVIDVERGLDVKVDVRTDEEISSIPAQIYRLIKKSVSATSAVRVDELGLEYPQVNAKLAWYIDNVVVKSVIQYKMKDSGYIVEIAIYRTWNGSATAVEPVVEASVSMFHPEWEFAMESIERTTRVRDFGGPGLKHLFPDSEPVSPVMTTGMELFFEEIMAVQALLVEASVERKDQVRAALAAQQAGGDMI